MEFWDNLYKECKIRGISPNKLGEILNITSGTITGWKKGSYPNADRLKAIADYFGVSMDYLMGRIESDPELPEDERKLLENYRRSDERGKDLIRKTAENEADRNQPNQARNIS